MTGFYFFLGATVDLESSVQLDSSEILLCSLACPGVTLNTFYCLVLGARDLVILVSFVDFLKLF